MGEDMMSSWFWLVLALFAAGLVLGIWRANRPRLVVKIQIDRGEARVVAGKPPDAYLKDVANICRLWNIQDGSITIYRGPHGSRVECRGAQIEPHSQAFANAWEHPIE
ncbi:MAG: hypothetical protein JJU36_05515 [Phycisphaeraceae bacterium]|nr:hypothetical protein [Phycisphaeraceae bacterium]